jgi:hypothetical protein
MGMYCTLFGLQYMMQGVAITAKEGRDGELVFIHNTTASTHYSTSSSQSDNSMRVQY